MPTTGAMIAAWAGTSAGTAVIGAGTAAVAGAAVSSMMAPKPPKPPAPLPMLQAPDGTGAANSANVRARSAGGLGSTILTGPQGLTDPATTAPKSLLGN